MLSDKWSVIFCILINIYYCFGQYEGSTCKIESSGVSGTCINLDSCPSAKEGIRAGEYPQKCGFIGRMPIVCCPKQDLTTKRTESLETTPIIYTSKPVTNSATTTDTPSGTQSTTSTTQRSSTSNATQKPSDTTQTSVTTPQKIEMLSTGEISKQKCSEYSKLSNSASCGIETSDLFFKELAKNNEFPHQALLGYENTNGAKVWSCSGALISDRFIITSAGCTNLTGLGIVRYVRLGDLSLSTPDGNRLQELTIEHIVHHPEYVAPATYNDIALIETTKPVVFNSWVRPACLQTEHYVDKEEPTRRYTVTSWNGSAIMKLRLENADMRCSSVYEAEPSLTSILHVGIIPDLVICAEPQLNNTCQDGSHDKGGAPMQIKHTKETCAYELVGVTSHAALCASKTLPGLYTRISYYIDWIEFIVWYK